MSWKTEEGFLRSVLADDTALLFKGTELDSRWQLRSGY